MGAPTTVCNSMMPIHRNIPAQSTPTLYTLEPSINQIEQGETLFLQIRSKSPEPAFTGFMVHARTVPTNEVVGVFTLDQGNAKLVKLITCDQESANDTATHADPGPKNNLNIQWTAPQNFEGRVIFNATVAQGFDKFWVGMQSPIIEVVKKGSIIGGISTTRAPLTTESPQYQPTTPRPKPNTGDPIYEGCGDTKGCFGFPDGCVKTKNCRAISVVHVMGDRYQFELKTGFPWDSSKPAYIALGLSEDSKMGDDSVMECVPENGKVNAYTSYTTAPKYASSREGVNQNIIRLIESSLVDGVIHCKIERQAQTTVRGKRFDLINDQYNLLLATGEGLKENSVGYHSIAKLASAQKQSLADIAEFKGASVLLLRIHGALMLTAWIGTASLGILFARYFKQTWVGNQLCGKDQWFVWHRVFMVLTWLLTVAGFIIIFVELGTWSAEDNPHAILGVITTVICFLQPIGALFRPAPNSKNRPIFNWAHWLGGNVAHILSIATIFYAVKLAKAELPEWMDWVLVAFVAFHVFMHLILSVSGCLSDGKNGKRVTGFPMTDLSPNRNSVSSDRKQDAPHSKLRKTLLGVYIVILILFVVALVLIAVLPLDDLYDSMKSQMMN